MFYVLVPIVVIAAGGLIYLATLEGRYEVCRSLSMQVDRQRVFDKIRDLASWRDRIFSDR